MQATGLAENLPSDSQSWGGRRVPPPIIVWLPAAAVVALLLLPLAYLLLRAWGGTEELWFTLSRPRTLELLLRSVALVVTVTGACAAIAVPLAWLTVRTDLSFRGAITVLAALPLVIPSYVGAFLLLSALGPRGMLQQALSPLGVTELPSIYGFPGAALSLSLLSFPYLFLIVRAALLRTDPSVEEVARSLGKTASQVFVGVTLPMLRPALAGGAVLVALYTLSDFGAVSLFRYETFTWAIYLQYRSAFDRTAAAVLSLVLVALALVVLTMESQTRGVERYARSGAGVARSSHVIALGPWRWPALSFCALVLALSLVLPIGVLVYWLALGLQAGERLDPVWEVTRNSLYVSASAAAVTTLAAVPLAVLTVRYRSAVARWIERAAYLSFALPGLVIALALVFFGAQYVPFIYQTIGLLVVAYLIHFLSSALASIRSSLLNISASVEEAARGLGQAPAGVLLHITAPLARPGLLASAAVVFLLTMKELPATLLLSPPGFKTLSTTIWSFAEAAFFARTAFPTLILLLASSIPMALLLLRETRWAR